MREEPHGAGGRSVWTRCMNPAISSKRSGIARPACRKQGRFYCCFHRRVSAGTNALGVANAIKIRNWIWQDLL